MIQLVSSEIIHLLAQRAVYWPAQRTLVIADIHFGKAAAFRAKGVPVPHGTTMQNLTALDLLISQHAVDTIVFLGDFLHARSARAATTLGAMLGWRERNPALHLLLVRGNHDLHAGDPPAGMRIEVVDEPHAIGPFTFCHHPGARPETYVFAGHVHPVFRLSRRSDALRLPCFVVGPQHMILPSFGAFTGGHAVTASAGERIFVAVDEVVVAVPGPVGA